MKVMMTGKSAQVADRDREYAELKLGKLSRFFRTVREANVTWGHQRGRHIVEVQLDLDGFVLRAEERNHDAHAAVDAVTDKLENQLRRLKGKASHHKGRADGPRVAEMLEALSDASEPGPAVQEALPVVARRKRVLMKPMSVEEAMLQLELVDHSFFAFVNADTGLANVLYRREDGNYGVLELQD